MSLWQTIVLAVVQGLTEFLPVSSSGHIVVANALLTALGGEPVEDLVEVSIVLHLGTLAAVLAYYRREIARLLTTDRNVVPLLIVGTIPAAVIGIVLKKGLDADAVLENVLLAGCCFPVTAALLWWSSRRTPGDAHYNQLTSLGALGIGALQAFALLPGISRSGSTIAAGLFAGLSRESAATFAFLLAIPAIAGAGLLESIDALKGETSGTPPMNLAIGFVVSMLVGYAALALLIRFVQRGQLARFAWYLVPLGAAVIAWQLVA
ncbi:MAG: undecaprenyl-diphosphate phosphatase [Planctomycetota bacterium]